MAEGLTQTHDDFEIFRLAPECVGGLISCVNHAIADEPGLKARLAIVRRGERLTDKLSIEATRGWFRPMLGDLLRQGISVVVNDIPISDDTARGLGRAAGVPADWVTQQNLYITPGESQGFDPHCDPHVVIVAHLYGRKEWTIFEKRLENPVYDAETSTIAGKGDALPVRRKITVAAGDCFVIPRGVYHSALALTPASVHLAIGAAGLRPVDYIWALAEVAIQDPELRADLSPEAALRRARDYVRGFPFKRARLPRFPRAEIPGDRGTHRLSFEDVLDALSGD